MKIGKSTQPQTAISTSDAERIVVRGRDLCGELVGHMSFTGYFFLLLTGREQDAASRAVLDACLIAIAELTSPASAKRSSAATWVESLSG